MVSAGMFSPAMLGASCPCIFEGLRLVKLEWYMLHLHVENHWHDVEIHFWFHQSSYGSR
jgi:hypothetical protein